MKYFAHRGNTEGRKPELENTKAYIESALVNGYCAEVDVWLLRDEDKFSYYLGHDKPKEKISREFLEDSRILVHAKNIDAFYNLLKFPTIHSFYQDKDDIALTSKGIKLYHCNLKDCYDFNEDEIYVDIEYKTGINTRKCYGVISDCVSGMYMPVKLEQEMFKLLVLDVDGVLTNGTKTYDACHNVVSKQFCDKDFTAIKRFISGGIKVVLLTGDEFNAGMARSRNLPFYNAKKLSNQLDKTVGLYKIESDFKVGLDNIAYVGDDYYDLSLLNVLKWSYCPSDAADIVKNNVKTIINRRGGEGVVEGLYELVKDKITQRFPYES